MNHVHSTRAVHSARKSKGWDTRKGQQSCFLTATRVHGRQRILIKDCTLKSLL